MKQTVARSPASDTFPHPLIARFAGDLARIWPEGGKLGLAVSGGPDSLALLLLAEAVLPGGVEVATVDHGLRTESGSEAAMVAELCAGHGIPHAILNVKVAPGNLQDSARKARYAALKEWAARCDLSAVATAHHADDQAETLVMRLNRASGVAGLAGVRARGVIIGSQMPVLRPLLGWRRAELAEIVEAAGLHAIQDPSNVDPRFDRVRIRQALQDCDWLDIQALASSASHLADAETVIQWASQREWAERVQIDEDAIRYRPGAPGMVRLRVLSRIIMMLGGEARGGNVATLLQRLNNARDSTLGGVIVRCDNGEWTFRKEPPRRA
jgi:tRNA(Ile)-lysidine synthase